MASAEIAVIGPKGADEILYRSELSDPATIEQRRRQESGRS